MEHLRNIRSDEILSARLLLNCLAGHPSVASPTLINLGNLDFRRRNNYKIFVQKTNTNQSEISTSVPRNWTFLGLQGPPPLPALSFQESQEHWQG